MIVITKRQGQFLNMLLALILGSFILVVLAFLNFLVFKDIALQSYVETGFNTLNFIGICIGIYNLIRAVQNYEQLKKANVLYLTILGSTACLIVNIYALTL